MFPRIRATGLWTDGTTVPGTQWEQFDENLSHAIDGLNGGVCDFAADLVLSGDPGVEFHVGLPTFFHGDFTVSGNAVFDGLSTTFNSDVDFFNPAAFHNIVNHYGGVGFYEYANFLGFVELVDGIATGEWDFNNDARFHEDVAIDRSLDVGTELRVGTNLNVGGTKSVRDLFVGGSLRFVGGYQEKRTLWIATVAPLSVSANDYDDVVIESTFVNDFGPSIEPEAAGNGATMVFVSQSTSLVIVNWGTGTAFLKNVPGMTGEGVNMRRIGLRVRSGVWRLFEAVEA